MNKRFSREQLFKIRNDIPIDDLIRRSLLLPNKISEGFFRFLCPACREFNTATNSKTNLARCFSCKRNFNTIDLMMLCKGMSFIQAVEYLQNYDRRIPEIKSDTEPHQVESGRMESWTSIGTVVTNLISDLRNPQPDCRVLEAENRIEQHLLNRLSRLEDQCRMITQRIQLLESEIHKR